MTDKIKKRIMAIANSPNPKDYDTLAKTINESLGYPLFDTEEHLESQFAILARLFERAGLIMSTQFQDTLKDSIDKLNIMVNSFCQ